MTNDMFLHFSFKRFYTTRKLFIKELLRSMHGHKRLVLAFLMRLVRTMTTSISSSSASSYSNTLTEYHWTAWTIPSHPGTQTIYYPPLHPSVASQPSFGLVVVAGTVGVRVVDGGYVWMSLCECAVVVSE